MIGRRHRERHAAPRASDTRRPATISQLSDGRCIAVSVQPMADGGTVTTHQDITEQRRSEAKIAHMALHDALTGLPNRVLLNERLEQALARVKRGEMVAVHLLDLDHFKNVNDTLGPSRRRQAAARWWPSGCARWCARPTRSRAWAATSSPSCRSAIAQPADATALALPRHRGDRARPTRSTASRWSSAPASASPSARPTAQTPDQLMRNADLALYRAKGDGRGTYRFFEPEMDAQMQARRAMEYDLRKALAAGEFELHYQPVVNLASNEISGFEALIRWRHPEKGMISPGAFIPLAEEIGFIVPLGEWAIRQACATAATWPGAHQGRRQPVAGAVPQPGPGAGGGRARWPHRACAPERLELEITETVLLQDSEATLAMLYQLRELGVRIAMDDFGTGYSSLSYLQSFPFDKIKIDRSFVKDIADGVGSLNIVRAVAAMAKGLGMATTAEGVETQEQLDTVESEGCTEMQGFLFSRPLPAEEIEKLYLERRRQRTQDETASAA